MGYIKDLTGQVFGRLTVLSFSHFHISKSGKTKITMWNCECSCPERNHVVVSRKLLQSGNTRSCGCLRREVASTKNLQKRKYNSYDLSGEYGIGYTLKGEEFWFDKEDYDKIKDYCWYYDYYGYLCTNIPKTEDDPRRRITFHIYVFGDHDENMVVDHIYHPDDALANKIDNRKQNLRLVTRSQNSQNQVPLRTNNTSGHKGVSWNKTGYWRAKIMANGEEFVEYFGENQYQEACDWYDMMSERLHGEFKYKYKEAK